MSLVEMGGLHNKPLLQAIPSEIQQFEIAKLNLYFSLNRLAIDSAQEPGTGDLISEKQFKGSEATARIKEVVKLAGASDDSDIMCRYRYAKEPYGGKFHSFELTWDNKECDPDTKICRIVIRPLIDKWASLTVFDKGGRKVSPNDKYNRKESDRAKLLEAVVNNREYALFQLDLLNELIVAVGPQS